MIVDAPLSSLDSGRFPLPLDEEDVAVAPYDVLPLVPRPPGLGASTNRVEELARGAEDTTAAVVDAMLFYPALLAVVSKGQKRLEKGLNEITGRRIK